MRFARLILPALALSALAACATAPKETAATAAAPAPTPGYDWFMHQEEGEAMLAYGVANSDDVKLRLDCTPGSGALALTALAAKAEAELHLESGGDTERYPATAEASEIHDGLMLSASAPAGDPVFQRFRRLGWIAAWRDDAREVYVAQPGSEKGVERFFAACG